MSDTLKQKTFSGFSWSFLDTVASHGLNFVIGVILARILSPRDFGLAGMMIIFITISNSFVSGGFGKALIRKRDCSNQDYSTVFIYNIVLGIVFYFILFFSSGFISSIFSEPQLQSLVQVAGIILIFHSLGVVPEIILFKIIDFKTHAKISFATSICYGSIAITMALLGYGVWSLVALSVSRFAFKSLFLWRWISWRPVWMFSERLFRELFRYSSKIMISNLIELIYNNLYYFVIGKYFSTIELGYYIKADQLGLFPSKYLNNIFSRVSFTILSGIQEDKIKFRETYRQILRSMMLVTFIVMMGIAAIAKPLIIVLIGNKWLPVVIYMQMLCVVGIFFPLNSLNVNILLIYGRSDIYLKLEIVKKIIILPIIVTGIYLGIEVMIAGMIIHAIISYYLNIHFSGKFIDYSFYMQIRDILPSFLVALAVSSSIFFVEKSVTVSPFVLLIISIAIGTGVGFVLFEIFKIRDYLFLKQYLLKKIISKDQNNPDFL